MSSTRMRTTATGRALRAAGLALAMVSASCGEESTEGGQGRSRQYGGTLRLAAADDVSTLDPGQIYDNQTYMLFRVLVRTLVNYSAEPGGSARLVGDLAADSGQVSPDGLTYAFTIREGVRYQPEVAGGRPVRSEDVRYAIERAFKPSVNNPYVGNYFQDVIVGDTEFAEGRAPHIAGIDVSDPRTVVFHLRRPTGDFLPRLALPVAAAVPEEYAAQFDAEEQSTYGPNFASTGPYMVARSGGNVTGYEPGRRLTLVRNPNWEASTDPIRKAYPDRVEHIAGFEDTALATDKILSGEFDYNVFAVPPDRLQGILEDPDQRRLVSFNPGNETRFVFLNTKVAPFDHVRVRQAANYVMDKRALRLAAGGVATADIATHVLGPGIPGHAEAGGSDYDPYPSEGFTGDVEAAKRLMREAGHTNGVYDGPPVLAVGIDRPGSQRVFDVIEASLGKIGIRLTRETYDANVVRSYITTPARGVAVGTDAWVWDYPDAVTVIKPLFDGRLIRPSANDNTSQLNDGQLNALIDRASAASGGERARLWGEADRRVMELAPVVPFTWPKAVHVVSPRVVGYQFTEATGTIDLAVVALSQPGS